MKSAYVDKWKKTDFLSLVADKQLNLPSYSVFDMTTGELIPLESIEIWIYFSYILCYSTFSQSNEVYQSEILCLVLTMWPKAFVLNIQSLGDFLAYFVTKSSYCRDCISF